MPTDVWVTGKKEGREEETKEGREEGRTEDGVERMDGCIAT